MLQYNNNIFGFFKDYYGSLKDVYDYSLETLGPILFEVYTNEQKDSKKG